MPKDSVSGRYYSDDAYKALMKDRKERAEVGEKVRQKVAARKVREAAMSGGRTKPKPSKPKAPQADLPPSSENLIRSLKSPLKEGYRRIRGG